MNKRIQNRRTQGFTLVEMLIVIGLIALLATAVLVAVNPVRQFKFARDTERKAHLATLLNALGQNMAEHGGKLVCGGDEKTFPSTASVMSSDVGGFDVAECVSPLYISKIPIDPHISAAHFTSSSDYNTEYLIHEDGDGHLTLTAKSELDPSNDIVLVR